MSTDSTFTIAGRIITDDSLLIDTSRTLGSLSAHGDSMIYWRVRAKSTSGINSNWSLRWAFSTSAAPVPASPVLTYPSKDSVLQNATMPLSWKTSNYATSYKVQVSTDSSFGSLNFESTSAGTSFSSSSFLSWQNQNPGITIYWRVQANNSSGSSAWSTRWNYTVFPPVTQVSPLNNALGVSSTPTLLWRRIGNTSTYRVQVSTDSTFTIAGRINTDDSLLIDTSRTLGSLSAHGDSMIFWRVRAKNAAGVNNSWSQRWAFSTAAAPAPATPLLLYPSNDTVVQSSISTLYWNSSVNASSYNVQVSTDSSFASINFDSTVTGTYFLSDSTFWSWQNQNPGITLYWRVKANNSNGSSPWSTRWNFTKFPQVNQVSPLNNSYGVSPTPILLWRKIGGASTYRVQASTDSTFTIAGRIITDDSLLIDTSKALGSLSAYGDSVIFWRVKAKNAIGRRNEWSQRWAFSTGALPVPAAPVLSYPSNDYVAQSTIMSLSWNASNYATSYKVQVSTDSIFGTTIIDSTVNGTNIYLLSSPQFFGTNYQGITLYWHVQAMNSRGNSPWSARWNFTSFPTINQLSPLNNASNVSVTPTLLWRKISGASTYRVQASTDSTFTIAGRIITDDSLLIDTSKTLGSLSAYGDSVIFWRVKAKNASGVRNEWSQKWAFSTGVLPIPAAPALLYPSNELVSQSTIMTLNWSASTYAASYNMQISTDSGFASPILDSTCNGNSVSLMFLLNVPSYQGKTIYWHVRASNSSGNSPWSARWSFTTFPKINHLSPLNNASGVSLTPTLLWLKILGASTYRVQVSTDSTFTISGRMIADDSLLVDTSKTLGSLSAYGDSLIFWRVRATNATGVRNEWSQQWAFTTGSLPGILVDDFENGTDGNKIGTYWYFWSDSSSIIHNAVGPQKRFIGGYTPGKASTYAGIMNFTVRSGSSYTEVGVGINLDNYEAPVNLTEASAVQFDIKANRPMKVKFQVPQSTITDYSYYESNINAGTSWMTVTVNLSVGAGGLSKPAWGSYVPFAINNATQLHWLYRANENMGIDSSGTISIDNIKIIGNPVGLQSPLPPLLKSPYYTSTDNPVFPTMIWHPVTGATTYRLQISTSDSMNSLIVNQFNITDTTYNVSNLSSNTKYYWRINASNGAVTSRWSSISWFSTLGQSDVIINSGWNMISLNVHPTDSNCREVFSTLRGFVLAKDNFGNTCYPAYGISDLDTFIPGYAYKVYSDSLDTLRATGLPIDVATPISLSAGWNMTAFLPQSNMSITTALAGIVSQVLLVKNNLGEIYMPDYSINTIGDMLVGQGYKMYMKNADTLVYPSGSSTSVLVKAGSFKSPRPGHFLCKGITGSSTTMLAEQVTIDKASAADNFEIGAFDEKGALAGSGVIMNGKAVFSVWGDNPLTKEKDGCVSGEKISFKLWDGVQEYPLEPDGTKLINYQDDAILTGKLSVPLKFFIKDFALKAISPNPVRNRLILLFDVPALNGKDAQEVTINIFGLNGRLVHQLIKGKYAAGHYSVTWDFDKGSASASNMFIVRMKSATFDKKLIMFRAK